MHYNNLKKYHCFGKTAHSWLSLSQFSVADTAGEPFLFSKSGHFRYVLQNLLRRSAWMAEMLRLIFRSWGIIRAYLKTQTSYINCTKSKNAVE